ncbi:MULTISPECIES: aspartyl-phosphate phosphatase Spo0E family protein [unclassified Anoxybacillus]|nr:MULTISPECIES: aspartyl-phosphate phosphatase Spo0E family protein [unclassified Anoxybacillus]
MSKIYDLRMMMIQHGINKGLSDPETIKYSQLLDQLILQAQLNNDF